MRPATFIFLALAFANASATSLNPTRGDERRRADAPEDTEPEATIREARARGDAGTSTRRRRLDADGERGGYESHQLRKEDRREDLEALRRRASEKLADHREGREMLGERDLVHLSRRMAALKRKMRSVDGETPERVSPMCLFLFVASLISLYNTYQHRHAFVLSRIAIIICK